MAKLAVVTGGCGFIGSHMVDLLVAEGVKVRVVDNLSNGRLENISQHKNNSDVSLEKLDIRDVSSNSSVFTEVDYVFHFAGVGDIVPSIDNPVEYMDINVQGTVRALEAARHAKIKKFVYAASSSCYGKASVPTDENHPIRCEYPYALSKHLGEQACFHWNRVYKLPVNSIRIFNAFGIRSRTSGVYGAVFGVFLKQKLAGHPFTVVGDGTQTRDFLYASDVARAFYLAAGTEISGEVFNLGAGKPQSVNRLVELLSGKTINIPKRPGEPDCTWANITKITNILRWKQEVSFEDGVKKVLDNIGYWENAPLWTTDKIEQATKQWFGSLA
ncbi:MAG: SDR family NAD(P)-dependent oxidoreductase [Holosporales bacterium]|jgi:UDP-glucose 4-epimerase|nr:SDR family NAD(P)-dependent oxidoreductase [Holosporales bacterium]